MSCNIKLVAINRIGMFYSDDFYGYKNLVLGDLRVVYFISWFVFCFLIVLNFVFNVSNKNVFELI